MGFVRKVFIHFLSLVLLIALLGAALSTGADWAFGKPGHLETWLSQSKVYNQAATAVTQQAPSSVTATIAHQSVTIPLDQATLNQAAQSSFSPQLIQTDVSQFLDANYAWLEGKTATPDFHIDLTAPENSFSQNVAKVLESHLATLPACSTAQLRQLGLVSFNPSTATCLPPTVSLSDINAQISQEIANNTNVLSNSSVLTANNLTSNKNAKPYYQSASWLPAAYKLMIILPLLLGGLALLCAAGVLFASASRRNGFRRLAWVFGEAGILLVLGWLAVYIIFQKHSFNIFRGISSSQLESALNDLAHRVASDWASIELRFGIGYLTLTVLILLGLMFIRKTKPVPQPAQSLSQTPTTSPSLHDQAPSVPPHAFSQLQTTELYKKPPSDPSKRPPLIQ
jgi:hypothetical protein